MMEPAQAKTLEDIRMKVMACRSCSLCEEATNAVPGDGSSSAKIFFIGEAPGKSEDIQGKPFVGAAGKFLDRMFQEAGLRRSDVFITNVVKHRPPGNRDPEPDEVEACWPWLEAQIQAVNPQLIVTLGRHAMERFMPGLRISDIHGQTKRLKGSFLKKYVFFPLYHPASALYNPGLRDTLLQDMKKIPLLLKKMETKDV